MPRISREQADRAQVLLHDLAVETRRIFSLEQPKNALAAKKFSGSEPYRGSWSLRIAWRRAEEREMLTEHYGTPQPWELVEPPESEDQP